MNKLIHNASTRFQEHSGKDEYNRTRTLKTGQGGICGLYCFTDLTDLTQRWDQMILIAQPTKPFSYTAKSTVRRQAVIKEYAAEIDTLFQSRVVSL